MGQAKLRGSFEQRKEEAVKLNSIKVEYSYVEPDKELKTQLFSLQEFFSTPIGKVFREVLLKNRRIKSTKSITIETVYPSTITMKFIHGGNN